MLVRARRRFRRRDPTDESGDRRSATPLFDRGVPKSRGLPNWFFQVLIEELLNVPEHLRPVLFSVAIVGLARVGLVPP